MLKRIQQLVTEKKDFAIETTLSLKSYMRLIKDVQQKDYIVTLLFLWLNNAEFVLA